LNHQISESFKRDEEKWGDLVLCFKYYISILKNIKQNPNKSKMKTIKKDDKCIQWIFKCFDLAMELYLSIGYTFQSEDNTFVYSIDFVGHINDIINVFTTSINHVNERLNIISKCHLYGEFNITRSFVDFEESHRFSVGFCDSQGVRDAMEDEIVVLGTGSRKRLNEDYFAVFDGHGGNEASTLAAREMHEALFKNLIINNNDGAKALAITFEEIDNMMYEKRMTAGTCALVMLALNNNLFIANTGDSRALLGKSNRSISQLSLDHSLESPEECERILKAGGEIKKVGGVNRVNGKIAVARSLGDSPFHGIIIHDPHISETPLTEDLLFIVLACDGVYEKLTNEQVGEITFNSIDPEDAARKIVETSLTSGTKDNVSVVVIYLKDRKSWGDSFPQNTESPKLTYNEKKKGFFFKHIISEKNRSRLI